MMTGKRNSREIGYSNRQQGETTQNLVANRMKQLGFEAVEMIETGWKVLWKGKKPIKAWPTHKVMGDIRAVLPGGRAVLVEVKSHKDRLPFSAIKQHQVKNLNLYAKIGAVALLAWVDNEIYIMQWPIPNFGPRKSIRPEMARRLAITSLDDLK